MCSFKVAIALLAFIALASALPVIGGENGAISPEEGESGVGGEENEGQGEVAGTLLGGGNLDVLKNLLGVLGPNPVRMGLLGNVTEIPSYLNDFLESIPEDVMGQVADLLEYNNLPINQLLARLNEIIPGNAVEELVNTVNQQVAQLLQAVVGILSNLPSVLAQVTDILNNKDQTAEQQTKAIEELKTRFPVELDTLFFIASRLAQTLRGAHGGTVTELPVPEIPSIPETPQVSV